MFFLPPSLPIAIGTSPTGKGDNFPLGGNKKGANIPVVKETYI
jgi:hypothetical protein